MSESEKLRVKLKEVERQEREANKLLKLRNSPEVVKALQLRDEGKNVKEISRGAGKSYDSWWSDVAKKLGEPAVLKRTRTVKPKTEPKQVMPVVFPTYRQGPSEEDLWCLYMSAAMTGSRHEETTLSIAARADEALEEHRQRFPRNV